jgi:hypothetical protein
MKNRALHKRDRWWMEALFVLSLYRSNAPSSPSHLPCTQHFFVLLYVYAAPMEEVNDEMEVGGTT